MVKDVLHINSFYFTNKVHYFFCILSNVDNASYFIPVYKNGISTKALKEGQKAYEIYSGIDKQLFFTKVLKCCWVAIRNYDVKKHSYIHAHTLFSDGLPAWVLATLYKKKLIITVRNTDINFYIKRSPLFRLLGKAILAGAYQVVVPSYAYARHLIGVYPFLERTGNLKVLRNGVAPFWIENGFRRTALRDKDRIRLLFVGKIDKNKNLEVLIRYLQHYTIGRGIELHIVGENVMNLEFEGISGMKEGNKLVYHGKIYEESELLKIYRAADIFVMLSSTETFGISYVEAMTQSLPVIYSRGEGIDGFFNDGHVGYSCSIDAIEELHEVLNKVINNYALLSENAYTESLQFNWREIIKEYENIL